MSSYNITAVLSAKDSGYTSKMSAAISQLEKLEGKTASASTSAETMSTKMGAVMGVVSTVVSKALSAVTACIGDAVNRFDTLNQFPKVMAQLGYSTDDATEASKKLVAGIQGLPTSLSEITANTQSLALLTGDLEGATDLALALNDAFFASGASTDEAARGLTQYTQMMSRNKVDQQSWNTLLETMGVALTDLAAEFGYTGQTAKSQLYQALQDGTVTFDDLNEALINLDNGVSTASDDFIGFSERALTASEGIGTSIQNVRTAVVTGLANMLQTVDDALGDAGFGGIATVINNLKDVVSTAFSAINKVIGRAAEIIAPLFKKIADNGTALKVVIGTLVGGFTALKVIDTVKTKLGDFSTAAKTARDTISKVNDLLDKYGSKQEAAATATQKAKEAEELAAAATDAQREADEKAREVKQLYIDQLKAQKDADEAAKEANELFTNQLGNEKEAQELTAEYIEASAKATDAQRKADQLANEMSEARIEQLEAQQTAELLAAEAGDAMVASDEAGEAAATLNNTQIGLKTVLLGTLTSEEEAATAAQEGLNAAMAANPIGLVITAVTTLVSVLGILVPLLSKGKSEAKKAAEENQELCDSLEETAEATADAVKEHENNIYATKQNAKQQQELIKQITTLKSKIDTANAAGEDSTAMQENLKSKVAELNTLLGEEAYSYDTVTNSLNATSEEMKAYGELAEKQAVYNELQEEAAKITDARTQNTTALAEADAKEEDAARLEAEAAQLLKDNHTNAAMAMGNVAQEYQNLMDDAQSYHDQATDIYNRVGTSVEDYGDQFEDVCTRIATAEDEMIAAQEAYDDAVANSTAKYDALADEAMAAAAEMYQANQDMIESGTIMYDDLSEGNQALVDSLNDSWDQYYEGATTFMEKLEDASDLSYKEMLQNAKDNQALYAGMAEDLGELRDKCAALGLDTAFLDQLEAMGVDGAKELHTLNGVTEEQLIEFAQTMSDGAAQATDNWTTSMGTAASSQIPDAVKGMVGETKQGLSNAIAQADWAELGESTIEGIVEGIEDMEDGAVKTVTQVATDGYKAYQSEIQSGSPSKVYEQYGRDQMDGLVEGVNEKKSQVTTALESVASDSIAALEKSSSSYKQYGVKAVEGVASGIKSVQSKVTAAAKTIVTACKQAFSNVKKDFKTYGTDMITALKSGVESKKSAAKSSSESVVSAMEKAYKGLESTMRGYGKDAMQGFIDGMESKRSAVESKAQSIANAASSTISSALKIGSPSKLMRQYGEWTAEGLAEGIESGERSVEKAAAKITEVMDTLAFPESYKLKYEVAGNLAVAGGMSIGTEYFVDAMVDRLAEAVKSRPVTINTGLEIDGRSFAKATVGYIETEQNRNLLISDRKKGIR